MEENPSVLIVSSSSTRPSSLIKLITKNKAVELKTGENGEFINTWSINTKYYETKVNLIGLDNDYDRSQKFNESVEALIIHMDSNKESGLDDLERWKTIETECDPEVKLLVSNYCTGETKITTEHALEWCLKRGFEFIELYPSKVKKDNDDEIIKEKVGVDRVIEALEAHTWPNLVMKPKHKNNEDIPSESDDQLDLGTKAVEECIKFVNTCEEYLADDGLDEFTDLFSQLNMMRDSLREMPPSQRKLCAEQMATAFWKAIGGDEEEISDL